MPGTTQRSLNKTKRYRKKCCLIRQAIEREKYSRPAEKKSLWAKKINLILQIHGLLLLARLASLHKCRSFFFFSLSCIRQSARQIAKTSRFSKQITFLRWQKPLKSSVFCCVGCWVAYQDFFFLWVVDIKKKEKLSNPSFLCVCLWPLLTSSVSDKNLPFRKEKLKIFLDHFDWDLCRRKISSRLQAQREVKIERGNRVKAHQGRRRRGLWGCWSCDNFMESKFLSIFKISRKNLLQRCGKSHYHPENQRFYFVVKLFFSSYSRL